MIMKKTSPEPSLKFLFSLDSLNSMGRCYHKTKRASIFLNQLLIGSENNEVFTLNFLDIIHHELLHLLMKMWKIEGSYSENKVEWCARQLTNLCSENLLSLRDFWDGVLN